VQELVPIRYGRMLTSAFAFYRGAAAIMAADLAPTPRSGLNAQLCGDAHLSNFGAFASPERKLVFDLNDFDETLPGPWEWDVKRLAASFAIGAREYGVDDAGRAALVMEVVGAYRGAMARFAAMSNMEVWYSRLDVDEIVERFRAQVSRSERKAADRNLAKMRAKDSMRALTKLTHRADGQVRIISDPPLIVPVEEVAEGLAQQQIEDAIRSLLRAYRRTLQRNRRHRSRATATRTWRERWSGWAASARAPGSSCCWDATTKTPCSCRPKRPSPRCSSLTWGPAASPTTASASSRASG
jgi:Uncharacterized protein conserved in bacteria (DUF2252)